MAGIEVSLSAVAAGSRKSKRGSSSSSSLSGGLNNSSSHRSTRDYYKEVDALRVALRDKENIIQTLKGQLCNSLSNRLALRNGAPPLTAADKKATEDRLQRLRKDADNKKLGIKNLKLALERLDITDNIDVRIQQAELEYRLGREELELLTVKEEIRALQSAIEIAEAQMKQKSDTIFSCLFGSHQHTIHAVEVSADPKSPRFGAGPCEDASGLYIDWAVEESKLCKGDRIVEVNGKLVLGAGKSELSRLLAVAPDAAQLVVLRRSAESQSQVRSLRSDNLRLTHRISYLEEQVRDLLATSSGSRSSEERQQQQNQVELPAPRQEQVQVFQKGPQVTALIAGLPGLNDTKDSRQSLPSYKPVARHSDFGLDYHLHQQHSSTAASLQHHHHQRSSRSKYHRVTMNGLPMAKSTASLDLGHANGSASPHPGDERHQSTASVSGFSRIKRPPRVDSGASEQFQSRRHQQLQAAGSDFDSEPTYYRMQDNASRNSINSEVSVYSIQENGNKSRPAPPKKPLRLSLHRAASLQSVESAPPGIISASSSSYLGYHDVSRKPIKRNYRGDPPHDIPGEPLSNSCTQLQVHQQQQYQHHQRQESPQPHTPSRTPSRAESCQSALKWPSPKPRPHLPHISLEKWC